MSKTPLKKIGTFLKPYLNMEKMESYGAKL